MATKIFIQNKYIRFVDSVDASIDTWHLLDNVYFEKNGTTFIFYKRSNDSIIQSLDFSNILNDKGVAYSSINNFVAKLSENPIEIPATAFGEVLVGQLTPQFQGSFEYTVDNTESNTNTLTNGGTVTQSEAMAVIGTSTTTGSDAELKTKTHAKYNAGLGSVMRFTALFSAGVADTKQMAGLVDEKGSSTPYKNDYMLGFNGVNFNAHIHQNDVMTSIIQSNFDDPLDGTGKSGMIYDGTKLNVFEIRFQYLGAGAIQFCIEDDRTGLFIAFHTVFYTNKNILPSVFNPNFHFTMYVENGGTTADIVMKSASYAYFIEGKTLFSHLHQPQFSSNKKEKTSVTTEIAIFTIRNKASYAGKTNFIDIIIEGIGASIEASAANNLGQIRLIKNTTLGGTPDWNDINTTDSVVEIDVAGTTVTGGKEMFYIPMAGKNDKELRNITDFKIIISPTDTITVAGLSANSATIDAGILWKELI